MNGIQVVAEARVGNDPELREVSGTPVCNLSLAVTERKQNKQSGQWEDGQTTWMRGAVWGAMAANVAASVVKGQLVNVTGTLSERKYTTNEGAERNQLELRVDMIAPSLRFATAQVIPNDRNSGPSGGLPPQQQYNPAAPSQAPWQQQAPAQQPQQQPQQQWAQPPAQAAQPAQAGRQWQTPAYNNAEEAPF
jgi:single-strand DNA-binding protein